LFIFCLKNFFSKNFVKLDNKLTSISTVKTCCKNACINSYISEGTCINNKGFVRIVDYLKVEYHSVEGKGWKIRKFNWKL